MHHQLLFSSRLISLQIVSPAFNLSQLPMMLFAASSMPLQGTCLHGGHFSEMLEEIITMCEGRDPVMVSSQSQLLCGIAGWSFFPCKINKNGYRNNKVSGEVLTCSPSESHFPVMGQQWSCLTLEPAMQVSALEMSPLPSQPLVTNKLL